MSSLSEEGDIKEHCKAAIVDFVILYIKYIAKDVVITTGFNDFK